MGVSLEVWRQRIGTFRNPSKASRGSSQSPDSTWGFDIGGWTFFVILLSVSAGFIHFNSLTMSGDIELNPGPAPLLSDEILQQMTCDLKSVQPPDQLCNKHAYQLLLLKEQTKSNWGTCVQWLRAVLPNFPLEDTTDWQKKIGKSFTDLRAKRRRLQSSKSKQPQAFSDWEEEVYVLPSVSGPRQTQPYDYKAECEKLTHENKNLNQEIERLELEVSNRQSPHKQVLQERREKRKSADIKSHLFDIRKKELKNYKLQTQLTENRKEKRKLSNEFDELFEKHAKLENEQDAEQDRYVTILENDIVAAEEHVKELKEELTQCKDVNATLIDAAINWRTKLAKNTGEKLHLFKDGAFTTDARACVWELLGLNVAQEKVPQVVEAVLNLAKSKYDRIPAASTVRNMSYEMLAVSQAHLKDLTSSTNLNLQTDETPKYGECYEAYIASDDSQNSYLIGMRHMADKSAQTTLDTLKEILEDIDDTSKQINNKDNTGHEILTKITSTMSDRAKTEHKFHTLLSEYREKCLPLYLPNWDKMGQSAKDKILQLHQFFCGLHLMVGMADTINATLKQIEDLTGTDTECDEFGKQDGESNIVRCVRTVCKSLAKGADPKSGRHRDWKTYCTSKNHPEYVSMLQSFKGNRFNIIFLLGGNLYFLRDHIQQCFSTIPEPRNRLIRTAISLMKSNFNIAGCKALGILRKFIMMPLWRLTESPGHIFEMNYHYDQLNQFLKSCAADQNLVHQLMEGKAMPLPEEFVERDEVTDELLKASEDDATVITILKTCLSALHLYVERTLVDHLPGGKYWQASDSIRDDTTSAPKHNKGPERVFGQLDFLVHHRPNASAMSNEAMLMFVYNKTGNYLKTLCHTEKERLCTTVRNRTKELKQLFINREKEILQKHIAKQELQAKESARKKGVQLKKKTDLTESIIDSGLWQTKETLDEMMADCNSNTEKKRALVKQLRFRSEVLNQSYNGPIPKIYCQTYTINKIKHVRTWNELSDCLLALIDAAACVPTSTTVSKNRDETEHLPLLVGKKIKHKFEDESVWYGKVISQVPGFCSWFNVKYENDDVIYSFRLLDDYKSGDLEILVTEDN